MRRHAVVCLLSLATLGATAQRLAVSPGTEVLIGTPLAISAVDLPPGATVTVRSLMAPRGWGGQRSVYRAEARFVADANGRVELATTAPQAGSYSGADVQGLFWSAQPGREPVPDGLATDQVRLSLHQGDRELASTTLTLRRSDAAVQSSEVPGFPGAVLVRKPGHTPRPVLIALGGSEGGSATVKQAAALWAAQGYAVLALPYYSPGGWGPNGPTPPEIPQLPAAFAEIPVDRLEQARAWLQQQPGLDAQRIGVIGVSKGAELALIAASRLPGLRSVVAVVPSDVVWEGWGPGVAPGQKSSFSFNGQPLPFVPYKGFEEEMRGFSTGAAVHIRRPQDAGRAAHPDRVALARIPVENYAGPLLVIGGGDDQVWDSGGMAQAIATRRQAAGRDTVALVYPQAGHALSGPGWTPTTAFNLGPMKMGGQPAADGRALADAWPKTVEFLRRTLGPVPD